MLSSHKKQIDAVENTNREEYRPCDQEPPHVVGEAVN